MTVCYFYSYPLSLSLADKAKKAKKLAEKKGREAVLTTKSGGSNKDGEVYKAAEEEHRKVAHTHSYIHAYKHTNIHTYTYTDRQTDKQIDRQTHTHTRTHVNHTNIQTYAHAYTFVCSHIPVICILDPTS